jgi:hypothetical protein
MAQDFSNYINTYKGSSVLQNQFPNMNDYLALFGYNQGTTPSTPTPTPTPTPRPGIPNIINQNINQYQRDGGGAIPSSPIGLTQDFMTATQERQNRLTNPNKVTEFFNRFTGGGQPDIGEMIRTGQIDTRKTSGIPLGIGAAFAKMMPDKYYDMSLGDQVFTQSQMGYTGPTVFGENTSGLQKDPFGLNVRSGFGNYAEAVGSDFASLSESLSGRLADKYGVDFDEETRMYTGKNLDAVKKANDMTKMMRTKFNFRKQQLDAKNRLDAQIKAAEEKRKKEAAAEQAAREANTAKRAMAANPEVYRNAGITSGGFASQNTGTNENFSNKTGRGRTGYNKGGLATMFKLKG